MAVSRLSIVKFLELVLTLVCIGLHYHSLGETATTGLLAAGTFVGFAVVLIGLFAGFLINAPINKKIDLFYSLLGCAMFIAAGVLIIQEWEDKIIILDKDMKRIAMAKGSLSVITGVLFFIDAVLTFRS